MNFIIMCVIMCVIQEVF